MARDAQATGKSHLELIFQTQARQSKVAVVRDFERQYRFHPMRKWLLDFAWLTHWVALEIEGGLWTGGAHARGAGIERDIEKANALTVSGWKLIRASNHMVEDGRAIALVETLLGGTADLAGSGNRRDAGASGRRRRGHL